MSKKPVKQRLMSRKTIVLAFAVFFGLIAVFALRANYSKMVDLRNAVYTADQQNTDIEGALAELREHVHSHMNTNLTSGNSAIKPPIQLQNTYQRLQKAEADKAKKQNQQVTKNGEQICAQRYPAGGFNPARVQCIQDYVAENAVTEKAVSDDLYKFDFISPKWSPDLAGISLVLSIVFFAWFVVLMVVGQIKKRYF